MDQVVGLTVMVKLKQPANAVVYGVVQDAVPNSHLALENVFFPESGTRWDQWTVQLSIIDDLEVVDPSRIPQAPPHNAPPHNQYPGEPQPRHAPPPPAQPFPAPNLPPQASLPYRSANESPAQLHGTSRPPNPPHSQAPPGHSHAHPLQAPARPGGPQEQNVSTTPKRQTSAFVDPAILSFAPSPVAARRSPSHNEFETPIRSMLARAAQNLPSPGSPFIGDIGRANVAQKLAAAAKQPAGNAAALQQAAKKLPVAPADDAPQVASPNLAPAEPSGKKKAKKTKKREPTQVVVADPPPVMNAEVSRNGNDMNGNVKRGKGWRSTPLLQPSPQAASPADVANTKKSRRRKDRDQEFAHGDTTDIQDMGDFDFEGELKKFDKKQVFDEIRQGDTTADEDRLVSHNRVHRPGTYGGKNLHPTEPVLSPKLGPKLSTEVDSASDADTELNFATARSSSRHSVSRAVLSKKQPSRQNSQHVESRPHPHPLSTNISNRSTSSLVSRGIHAPSSLPGVSPRPERSNTPPSARSTARVASNFASKPHEPHFAIRPDMLVCPTLLPGALDALEAAAIQTFGLSADALTETAARHIAEAAVHLSEDHSLRRPSRTSTLRGSMTSSMVLNPPAENPVIVILAGNHAVGARALAAARHLVTRGFQVISAESIYDDIESVDPQRRAQISILRKMRSGGANIKRGRWPRASGYIKQLPGPPAVIIDALLAGTTYDALRTAGPSAEHTAHAQQEVREIIEWANRSRAPVLSIGCPSGVDGISGLAPTVEGEPLAIRPDKVLALGAPLQGLLKAIEAGEKWPISLADMGANIALRSEEAVAFGGNWVVELEFVFEEMLAGEVGRGR